MHNFGCGSLSPLLKVGFTGECLFYRIIFISATNYLQKIIKVKEGFPRLYKFIKILFTNAKKCGTIYTAIDFIIIFTERT